MVGRCGPRLKGLISVGPLLAVLMSLQQGEDGIRCPRSFAETADFSQDIAGLPNFLGIPATGQIAFYRARPAAGYRAGKDRCPVRIARCDAMPGARLPPSLPIC